MSKCITKKCEECGKIISTCRCMSNCCDKTIVSEGLCNSCKNKKENTTSTENIFKK